VGEAGGMRARQRHSAQPIGGKQYVACLLASTYSIRIHEHRHKCGGKVDETILERLLQCDLGLDDVARRLLWRHDG
jgi:hypothetical protein